MSLEISKAKSKYLRVSPYKLRGCANLIRGVAVDKALGILGSLRQRRAGYVEKVVRSAYANACSSGNSFKMAELFVKEICVDQGPIISYFKPGAMGRACPQRKRLCHVIVKLDALQNG